VSQNINNWEALIIGDGCQIMQNFIDSDYFKELQDEMILQGNKLIIENNSVNRGGCGYAITNENIKRATGKYFVFFANDDIILPNHFENYLSEIENTDYDFMYFNSFVKPINASRISELRYGMIGHSELIIKTEFLKTMPLHSPEYGHDWELIKQLITKGKHKKSTQNIETYHVMSLSDNKETGIE
jgi:hypothetical protein